MAKAFPNFPDYLEQCSLLFLSDASTFLWVVHELYAMETEEGMASFTADLKYDYYLGNDLEEWVAKHPTGVTRETIPGDMSI